MLVYGDVNSIVESALVAATLGIRVGDVEAGLGSRDWSMPEEIIPRLATQGKTYAPRIAGRAPAQSGKRNGERDAPYALATRRELLEALAELSRERQILFPVYPRTRAAWKSWAGIRRRKRRSSVCPD